VHDAAIISMQMIVNLLDDYVTFHYLTGKTC